MSFNVASAVMLLWNCLQSRLKSPELLRQPSLANESWWSWNATALGLSGIQKPRDWFSIKAGSWAASSSRFRNSVIYTVFLIFISKLLKMWLVPNQQPEFYQVLRERTNAEHSFRIQRLQSEVDNRPLSASSLSASDLLQRWVKNFLLLYFVSST